MSRRVLKKYLSAIALFLSVVMLIFSTPVGVVALDDGSTETQASESASENGTVLSDDQQNATDQALSYQSHSFVSDELIGEVIEVTDRREENVKHFALSDGTFQAIVYSKPVHRMDDSGVWQDIDNNLSLSSNKYSTSDGRVSFSNNTPSLTLSENGYTVVMEYAEPQAQSSGNMSASQTVFASGVTNSPDRAETFESLDEAIRIDNKSSITYTTQNRASIEYILDGNDVKENIIINEESDSYEYFFKLTLGGLTASLNDKGDILLCDGDETKYVIPAPFMYDADGNISYDVDYELIQVKNNLYLICIIADSTWINADGRSFPVTVDPTISSESIMVLDAHVSSANPNTNYHNSTYLEIGNGRISYIYVEPPSLPPDITVNTATFNVNYYYGGYEGSMTVGVHAVSEMWAENEITYNQRPAYESTPISTVSMTAYPEYSEYSASQASVSIKPMVTNWVTQSSTSGYNGLAFVYQSGSIGYIKLVSSESSADMGAFISINYSYNLIDGVYAFKNLGATNRWMTTELATGAYYPEIGANLQQKYSSTSPTAGDITETSTRASLFKVTKVAEATSTEGARYVIRSMLDNSISFGVSGTAIVAKTIPYDDADVAIADTFYIEPYNDRYFYIRPYGSTKVINVTNTSTVDLATIEKTSASTRARWEIYRYTGNNRGVYTFTYPTSWISEGIIVENSGTVTVASEWSTYTNVGNTYVEIPDEYNDMGTFTWNETTHLGAFIAENPGAVQFVGKMPYGNNQVLDLCSYTFQIVPQEGTYYIQNAETEKYVDIEGPSTASGASIQQWQYHTGNQAKWNIEHVSGSGGYVRIKSVYSNLYMGVNSSNTSQIKQYSTQNDYTLWKINRSSVGNLILVCKATESSGKALAVPTAASSNGTDLTQSVYAEDSNFGDEWTLKIIKYSFEINHYVDDGYKIRFSSTGQDVAEYQDICSEILLELFGIESTYTISTYYSCADTCTGTPTTLLNTTIACIHSSINHKTRLSIRNDIVSLFNAGDDTTAKIAWTGHVLESRSSCSYPLQHVIIMTIGMVTDTSNNNLSSNVIRYQRIYTLLHEISHQLGAPDHYCYDRNSTNCDNPTNDCWRCDNGLSSPPVCIMTSRTYDIEERLSSGNLDTLYCSQCKSSTHPKGILTHLDDHHK